MLIIVEQFSKDDYRKAEYYWIFSIIQVAIFLILIYSKVWEKPFLVRICIHLIIVMYLLKWLNIEDSRSFDDFDYRIR